MDKEAILKAQIEVVKAQLFSEKECLKKLQNQLFELEQTPKLKALMGKCYRYRNSCGAESWWLYSKVIGYNSRERELIICSYEVHPEGSIHIEISNQRVGSDVGEDYWLFQEPITRKQFDANLNRAIEHLEKMKTKG